MVRGQLSAAPLITWAFWASTCTRHRVGARVSRQSQNPGLVSRSESKYFWERLHPPPIAHSYLSVGAILSCPNGIGVLIGHRHPRPQSGSSETSRSGQVCVGFGADGRLHTRPLLIVCCPSARMTFSGVTTKDAICRDFTGATGLEPATSGVTGRSWWFRGERERAGISRHEQDFSPPGLRGLPGTCGSFRRPPAGSARDGTLSELATRGALRGCVYRRGRRPSTSRLLGVPSGLGKRKRGHAPVFAATKVPQAEGIGQRELTLAWKRAVEWCPLHVPCSVARLTPRTASAARFGDGVPGSLVGLASP